ncbi:dethiobiotin synthase [Methylomonas sp. MgM2]
MTGTDTNVGKTWASVAIMRALQAQGRTVTGMKPVAAGCEWSQGGWKNGDALLFQQYSSLAFDYKRINPYAFEKPVSPHIACGNVEVSADLILRAFGDLQVRSDCVVVEGAGGWLSPLGRDLDNAALAKLLEIPIILVVGMRLGCINHARLTAQAIRQAELPIAGWLAVQSDPDMTEVHANLDFLRNGLNAPLLGVLPNLESPDFGQLASRIKI